MIELRAEAFSPESRERVIARFAAELEPSRVGGGERSPGRSSSSARLAALRLPRVERAIAELAGAELELERWQLLRYRIGEGYLSHYDSSSERRRAFSAIVYLRAPELGGETVFPRLRRTIVPSVGTLVVWPNEWIGGELRAASLHEARPVLAGEKWALVTWGNVRPARFRRAAHDTR